MGASTWFGLHYPPEPWEAVNRFGNRSRGAPRYSRSLSSICWVIGWKRRGFTIWQPHPGGQSQGTPSLVGAARHIRSACSLLTPSTDGFRLGSRQVFLRHGASTPSLASQRKSRCNARFCDVKSERKRGTFEHQLSGPRAWHTRGSPRPPWSPARVDPRPLEEEKEEGDKPHNLPAICDNQRGQSETTSSLTSERRDRVQMVERVIICATDVFLNGAHWEVYCWEANSL